jgi:hypothetical protein
LPSLKLVFAKKLNLPIFTNNTILDSDHNAIEIHLMDANTNCIIPPPDTHLGSSSVRLEVLVLDGDFCREDRDWWTADQFNAAIVKAREGKRPLLVGSVNVPMNNHGVAVIDDVSFTDNSSWIRCRRFRIGVRIMPESHFGARIQEAISESFTVKDHRGECKFDDANLYMFSVLKLSPTRCCISPSYLSADVFIPIRNLLYNCKRRQ